MKKLFKVLAYSFLIPTIGLAGEVVLEGDICQVKVGETSSAGRGIMVQFDQELGASSSYSIIDEDAYLALFVENENYEYTNSRGEKFKGQQYGDGYQIDMTGRYTLNNVSRATSNKHLIYTFDGEFNLVRLDYRNTRETPRLLRRNPRLEVEEYVCYFDN